MWSNFISLKSTPDTISLAKFNEKWALSYWDTGYILLYLCAWSSSFSFWLIAQPHENRHTCSFAYCLEYALSFLDDDV